MARPHTPPLSPLTEHQIISAYHFLSFLQIASSSAEVDSYFLKRMSQFFERHSHHNLLGDEAYRASFLYGHTICALTPFGATSSHALPIGAVAIPLACTTGFSEAEAYRGPDGLYYLIVDFLAGSYANLIIPLLPRLPYPNAPSRQVLELKKINLLPLYFVNNDRSVGVPVLGPWDTITDESKKCAERTSLKVLFHGVSHGLSGRGTID
jgi:hypothetical protein